MLEITEIRELTIIERLALIEKRARESGDLFSADALADDIARLRRDITPEPEEWARQ